jgi:hypothetical protein
MAPQTRHASVLLYHLFSLSVSQIKQVWAGVHCSRTALPPLVDMYDINYNNKSESLARKLDTAFATGFVDVEEICRLVMRIIHQSKKAASRAPRVDSPAPAPRTVSAAPPEPLAPSRPAPAATATAALLASAAPLPDDEELAQPRRIA